MEEISDHPVFELKEFVGTRVSDGERRFFQITTFCFLTQLNAGQLDMPCHYRVTEAAHDNLLY